MTNTPVPAVVDDIAPTNPASEVESYPLNRIKQEEKEKLSKGTNTELYVRHYFADLPVLAKVAYCESRFRQFDKNGKILRGIENRSDVGVMQVNEYYHLERAKKMGIDIYTLDGNLSYARDLYEREGARPWMASSPCWAKFNLTEVAIK